jgi:hypothetical protein
MDARIHCGDGPLMLELIRLFCELVEFAKELE